MRVASRDRGRAEAGTELERQQVRAHLVGVVAAIALVAGAQATCVGAAPALDLVGIESHAREAITRLDLDDLSAEIDRGQRVAHLTGFVAEAVVDVAGAD